VIGIINYGMGNIASVKNALEYLDIPSKIITKSFELKEVDKLILPGVGAFGDAMERLHESGISDILKEVVIHEKKPLLGICLGMQLLLTNSCEHGMHSGLNLIEGEVENLSDKLSILSVPHVGWNDIVLKKESKILEKSSLDNNYYFTHSYFCNINDKSKVSATSEYGIEFDVVIEYENIFGCQFHPEKSHKNGLEIIKKFSEILC